MIPHERLKSFKLQKNVNFAFLYSILVGLGTHFFILTNKLINHDDLEQLVSDMDYSSSGRWFLKYASLPSSMFSMPWVNGLFIIIYTAIICSLIVYIFNIQNKLNIFIVSSFAIMFPTNAALFHYSNSADAYMLGAMIGVIGIYFFIKYKYGFILTSIFTTISLATYQSFFGFFLAIILMYYLIQYINEKIVLKAYLFKIAKVCLTYIISIIMYLLSVKTIQLSSYQNIDKMGKIDILNLPKLIIESFARFFTFLVGDDYYQYSNVKYLNVILIISVLYLIFRMLSNKKFEIRLITWINVLVFPIVINLIYIMAPTSAIGLRLLVGYIVFYFIIAKIMEDYIFVHKKLLKEKLVIAAFWAINIVLFVSLYRFYIVTNKVYMTLEIDSVNVASYTTRVIYSIESKNFYSKEKEVYFIGSPTIITDFTDKYTTPDVVKSTILSSKLPANWMWHLYPERYSAFPNHITLFWKEEFKKIQDKSMIEKIKSMPKYPENGSIQEYKDKIIVKFKHYN